MQWGNGVMALQDTELAVLRKRLASEAAWRHAQDEQRRQHAVMSSLIHKLSGNLAAGAPYGGEPNRRVPPTRHVGDGGGAGGVGGVRGTDEAAFGAPHGRGDSAMDFEELAGTSRAPMFPESMSNLLSAVELEVLASSVNGSSSHQHAGRQHL